ncbi:transporter substrate-binding domain-containing protein [bacterium]|nr:transporter substrate-binding domain-containing protein [bacterium]
MTRLIKRFFIVFIVIISPLMGLSEEPVRIAIGEWPPYLSKELKHFGVAAHIVTEAFAKEGIDVQYTFLPWKRVEKYVISGEQEGSIMWVQTEERDKVFLFTEVMLEGQAVFFHLKSFPFDWQTYHDLAKLEIGGLLSATYPWVEKAREQGIQLRINPVVNEVQNFQKLLLHRIDVYGMDILIGYELAQRYLSPEDRQKITHHPRPVEIWPYRLIFSKQVKRGPRLVEAFNKGILRLKAEKSIQNYLDDFRQGKYQK